MTHKKIRIPKESANEILMTLGNLKNTIEFEDLNKEDLEAKKNFWEIIKRCDEMKKKIGDYYHICNEFKIPFYNFSTFAEFHTLLSSDIEERDKKFGSTYFDLLENEIEENDRKINELVDSHAQLREDLVILIEKKYVFEKASELFRSNLSYGNFGETEADEDGIKKIDNTNLVLLAGTVPAENELKMKRMIFRISRGNAITTFYGLEINKDEYLLTSTIRQRGYSFADKKQNILIEKDDDIDFSIKQNGMITSNKKIFSVVFTGGEEDILLKKILRVCEIFQASRYSIPRNQFIRQQLNSVTQEITDKRNMIVTLEKNLNDLITETNTFKQRKGYKYSLYRLFFEQQKLIYTTMGKCIVRENFIDGQVWIPVNQLELVQNTLNNLFIGQENKLTAHLEDIPVDTNLNPPTLITTNEFTYIPQLIVDTYGVPRYQEINPGYFTIVTFPFLFGVMFGDIAHSIFLLIFAFYLMYNNKKFSIDRKSIFNTLESARYFLFLMGFFSLFCGLLYNDFLSVPLYFKSCYPRDGDEGEHLYKDEDCKFSFGLDPVWTLSSNELTFVNSLKMKFSVIIGVIQMLLGILIKGGNALFEKDLVEFIFVFIPQLVFMVILFGYMDFLIFLKWSTNYTGKEDQAPDIKSYLMNIFLKLGELPSVDDKDEKDWILLRDRSYTENLHLIIFFLSIMCLFLMFLPKIFLNFYKAKEKIKFKRIINIQNNIEDNMNENLMEIENKNHIKNVEINEPLLSDFFVASVIETIEYALGTVSNTASYLRLWALSLAHSQLSAVFFKYSIGLMSMKTDYYFINGFLLSIIFIIFATVTFGVLLCMDLMECFLHTLRLHWVEFQNKFYRADGYKFQPFCFETSIVLDIEENIS